MHGYWPFIYFGAIAVVAFGLSSWGTRVVLRQPDVPRVQRRWQLVLVWVVPVLGAFLVIEMYRVARRLTPLKFCDSRRDESDAQSGSGTSGRWGH
jgi:hypothetical protein